jgi:hypothetical protein
MAGLQQDLALCARRNGGAADLRGLRAHVQDGTRRSGRALVSFVVVAAGACASAAASEMRPQVFSFVFFALAVLILQRFHERGSRVLWLLAPLFLI